MLAALWLAMYLLGGKGSVPDMAVLASLYAGDQPTLAGIARIVTELGGWRWLTALSALFALILFLRGETRRAWAFVAIVLSGRLMVEAQKWVSARARPDEQHLVTVTSLSFPSGHSANAAIVYFTIALLLAPSLESRWSRRLLLAGAAIVSVAVGFSRMILGVHWPSDVVGGWAFGLFWTLALLWLAGLGGSDQPRSSGISRTDY